MLRFNHFCQSLSAYSFFTDCIFIKPRNYSKIASSLMSRFIPNLYPDWQGAEPDSSQVNVMYLLSSMHFKAHYLAVTDTISLLPKTHLQVRRCSQALSTICQTVVLPKLKQGITLNKGSRKATAYTGREKGGECMCMFCPKAKS